jgi:hypothetical protein
MELTKTEVEIIEKTVIEVNDAHARELSELQLVLVGGGIGDPIAF